VGDCAVASRQGSVALARDRGFRLYRSEAELRRTFRSERKGAPHRGRRVAELRAAAEAMR